MAVKAGIVEVQKNPQAMTLATAYVKYIEQSDGVLSPSTIAGYKRLSRNTFQRIMLTQLKNISNEAIQREIQAMSRRGLSPKSISNAVGLLSAVLKTYAPDFRLDVNAPQKKKPDLRMLSDDEIQRLMEASKGKEIELPILFALWMGMRLSEIRGLKFKDFKNGRVHICRAVVDDESGTPQEKGTKTYSGDRWIDVPEYVQTLIPEGPPEENVVKLSGQAIYKRFSRLLESAGIEHCRFHDLRRANAAIMTRQGIDSKYAQERNGWATDNMYKQVYGYVMADKMQEASAKIDSYFDNKIGNEK